MLAFLRSAAAPVALFVLGVTVALRPFGRVPWEVPGGIAVKLIIHPLIVFALMIWSGPFTPEWAATTVLMASLPPALNVFVIARQYDTLGRTGISCGLDRRIRVGGNADQRNGFAQERPDWVLIIASAAWRDQASRRGGSVAMMAPSPRASRGGAAGRPFRSDVDQARAPIVSAKSRSAATGLPCR
jgi:hypothetical protein